MTSGLVHRCVAALTLVSLLSVPLRGFANNDPLYPELYAMHYGVSGSLNNGLNYCVQPQSESADCIVVEAFVEAGWTYEQAYERGYAMLLSRVLGQGSQQLQGSETAELLHKIAMNQDITVLDPSHSRIRLVLPAHHPEDVETALYVISQMLLYPQLDDDFISHHCLQLCQELKRVEQAGMPLPGLAGVQNPTQAAKLMHDDLSEAHPAELRIFYEKNYQPSRISVFVRGMTHNADTVEWIEQYFETPERLEQPPADLALRGELEGAQRVGAEKLQLGPDLYPLVDGKLIMEEPSFIQKRFNGRLMGLASFVAGVGLAMLGVQQDNPLFFIGTAAGFLGGLPWLAADYDQDPIVVADQRAALKQLEFGAAIQDHRVQERLTAQELREKLLDQHLAKPSIDAIATRYTLSSPLFRSILHDQERDQLTALSALHARTMNRIEGHSAAVDEELTQQLGPYKAECDALILRAKNDYDMQAQVRLQQSLHEERDRRIERVTHKHEKELKGLKKLDVALSIDEAKAQKRDLEELRDRTIAEIKAEYAAQLSAKQLATIKAAALLRDQAIKAAQARYQEVCGYWKAQLNYEQRKASHSLWLEQMRAAHNQKLVELLRAWPRNIPNQVCDYLVVGNIDLD